MRVSFFITCLADLFYPQVGQSVVRLLRRYGCQVDFPQDQVCCGQPAYNSGYHQEAARAARQMLSAFNEADYVVTPSGSCAAMIRQYYPKLAASRAERREAQLLAEKYMNFPNLSLMC